MPDIDKKFDDLRQLDAEVIGVSTDSVPCHEAWSKEINLQHTPLAADIKGHMVADYGMFLKHAHMANRGTVIIGKDGIVRWIHVVRLDQAREPNEVLTALRRIEGK